jgi:hypothetical protein
MPGRLPEGRAELPVQAGLIFSDGRFVPEGFTVPDAPEILPEVPRDLAPDSTSETIVSVYLPV